MSGQLIPPGPIHGEAIDAEYVVVDSPSDGGQWLAAAQPARQNTDDANISGLEMLRGRPAEPSSGHPAGPAFWLIGAAIAGAAFWVSGGYTLVSKPVQQAAVTARTKELRIASVISEVDRSGTRPVLKIDGKAVNDGARSLALPPLQIQVVATDGGSTLYRLGTGGQSLDGGGSFDFSSRLDVPNEGVRTVFVTFAD